MNALLSATPPTIGRPLPELQQVEFGSATMGWLDFAAPALLGLLVQRRAVAGIATGIAASLWGLLLLATSPIAATPPVLVGLIAGEKRQGRSPPDPFRLLMSVCVLERKLPIAHARRKQRGKSGRDRH